MKKSGRNIIKSIAFALVAVMIMGVLGAAFTPKRSDPGSGITNSNARGFYGEPKNSIDVLVLETAMPTVHVLRCIYGTNMEFQHMWRLRDFRM